MTGAVVKLLSQRLKDDSDKSGKDLSQKCN